MLVLSFVLALLYFPLFEYTLSACWVALTCLFAEIIVFDGRVYDNAPQGLGTLAVFAGTFLKYLSKVITRGTIIY